MFKLILSIAVIYLIGLTVLKIILPDVKRHLLETLALSFGLGTGVISLITVLIFHARISVDLINLLSVVVFLLIYFIYRENIKRSTCVSTTTITNNYQDLLREKICSLKNIIRGLNTLEIFLILVVAVSVVLVSFHAMFKPMFNYDAISIWAFKAKIFFTEQTIFTDDFYNPDRLHYHPKYPILIPSVENWIYNCLGCISDRLVKIIFPLFYVSLLFLFYTAQRRSCTRQYSLIFTALLATIPAFVRSDQGGGAFSGYADMPLAFFYASGVIYLFLWMKYKKKEDLIISAILSGLAMFTKNEGLGYFIITFFCLSVFILFNTNRETLKQNIKFISMFMVISGFIVLPWLIISMGIPVFSEEENYPDRLSVFVIVGNFSRVPIIFTSFCGELIDIRRWNIIWILFGVAVIGGMKYVLRSLVKYLILMLLLDFAMLVLVYIIIPWDVRFAISTSMTRLIIQITPVAVFIVSQQIGMVMKCENDIS